MAFSEALFYSLLLLCLSFETKMVQGSVEYHSESAVQQHNIFRRQQSASNMKMMIWDRELAEQTASYASQCKFAHDRDRGRYGENIYVTTRQLQENTTRRAIESWYNEIVDYTYESNTCIGTCGHYTQVVWANSYKLGCAAVACPSGITNFRAGTIVICRYGPPGNYVGQRPYSTGETCSQCDDGWGNCLDNLCATDDMAQSSSTTTQLPSSSAPATLSSTNPPSTTESSPATTAPPSGTAEFEADAATEFHNNLRRRQNAANMKMMEWDQDLAEKAATYGRKCIFAHDKDLGFYGENIYVTTSTGHDEMMYDAIEAWYNEISDYNYRDNSCNRVCGHYTQVVWATSYKLGCAVISCPLGIERFHPGTMVICRYGPPGNWVGQRPFASGDVCSECDNDWKNCVDGICARDDMVPRQSTTPSTTTQSSAPPSSTTVSSSTAEPTITSTNPPTSSTTDQPTVSTTTEGATPTSTPPSCPNEGCCAAEYQEALSKYKFLMAKWKDAFEKWTEKYSCN